LSRFNGFSPTLFEPFHAPMAALSQFAYTHSHRS
jgi:hypothetical protein